MIITQLSPEQTALIPSYVEKWRAWATATMPISRPELEVGLQDLHREIGLEVPEKFFFYDSPQAAWRDIDAWKEFVTHVENQYWGYQLPLCAPWSMHRSSSPGNGREAFNFAATRYSPGYGYALAETAESHEESGTLIDRSLNAQLWKQFRIDRPFDINEMMFQLWEGSVAEQFMSDKVREANLNTQVVTHDQWLLGPESWLLQELACVDFCHHELGIARNECLYRSLESIVTCGSVCVTVGYLCLCCERPAEFTMEDEIPVMIFRDGERYKFDPELRL